MFYLPQEIPAIRHAAEDALRPAFDHSDVANVSEWVQRCIDDKAQLWRLRAYWVISEVQDTKNGLAVHLVFSAGGYEPELVDAINTWAKAKGCKKSFFSGRPGCQRKRPDYRLKYITMEKDI
jgi:hypothetical protein